MQIECQSGYLMMPISNGICQICRAEQKDMPFFGTVTKRDFRGKSKSQKHITNDATLRFWIFLGFTDKNQTIDQITIES